MNQTCWWLVDWASRLLESDERDAVLGDFAESGESAGPALRDVLELVARRQAALWADWRPWLILVWLIVPLALLLSIVSRLTADKSASYIWMYTHWWNWAFLGNPGFRTDFAHYAALICAGYMTLACWSWTSGFVLGSTSCRVIQVNGVLFCIMLLLGETLGAPAYFSYFQHYIHTRLHIPPIPQSNDAVFAGTFYGAFFPLLLQAALVAVPALWGMRQGLRVEGRQPLLRAILWTAAIASLAALVVRAPGFVVLVGVHRRAGFSSLGLTQLLRFIVYWPAGYFVARIIARRWRLNAASA